MNKQKQEEILTINAHKRTERVMQCVVSCFD